MNCFRVYRTLITWSTHAKRSLLSFISCECNVPLMSAKYSWVKWVNESWVMSHESMSQWVNESMRQWVRSEKTKGFGRNNKIKHYFYLFCLLPSLLPAQGLFLTWNLALGCLLAVPRPCRIAEAKNKPA